MESEIWSVTSAEYYNEPQLKVYILGCIAPPQNLIRCI